MKKIAFNLSVLFVFVLNLYAENNIPSNKVLPNHELAQYLNTEVKLQFGKKKITEKILAKYFRQKFSERFFYDWRTFPQRFDLYNQLYKSKKGHAEKAADHIQKFAANTPWLLPFNYLNGEKVNAYAIRHLARQHKMVDVAFTYFYENKNPLYLNYFINQRNSLNQALETGKYESVKNGNGVFEVFHSGYRILNWLTIHNMFIGESLYNDSEQLITIATLLQHGADLYKNNPTYKPGNHQTRGMSALAMISILLRDFKGTDLWYKRAMAILGEHLAKEVNNDGFQFERSVHYHISDIENYFYVYQLAKISNTPIEKVWEEKLKSMFTALVKIAFPDKTAPVLQDDTGSKWAESNEISGILTLGYLLFKDPEMGYFAENKVDKFTYWFLQDKQMKDLTTINKTKPKYGSVSFPDTHYYIMREGWEKDNKMMIITAGLDKYKPDHQHGDMLGVEAYANGRVILPNYQVSYSLPDFEFFKNSMVKNVALVDDELQGKNWALNKGESGFGKFQKLPQPKTIAWKSENEFDFFAGFHDGFENIGVKYSRQVIFVKNDFWIVKDNFNANSKHDYKQVWQGHYNLINRNLLQTSFENKSYCDIFQLIDVDSVSQSGSRGKKWSVVSKSAIGNFSFITLIHPYQLNKKQLMQDNFSNYISVNNWIVNNLPFKAKGENLTSFSNKNQAYIFNLNELELNNFDVNFLQNVDIFVNFQANEILLYSLSDKTFQMKLIKKNNNYTEELFIFNPAQKLILK